MLERNASGPRILAVSGASMYTSGARNAWNASAFCNVSKNALSVSSRDCRDASSVPEPEPEPAGPLLSPG